MKTAIFIGLYVFSAAPVFAQDTGGCPQCSVPAPQPTGAPSGPGAPPCGPNSPTGSCLAAG